jgi:hypothetical protein
MHDQPNERTRQLPVRKTGGEIVYTTVDEIDWLWAQSYNWKFVNGYAARNQRRGQERKLTRMWLHREILGLKHGGKGKFVDHINGDPLDNRRSNLRVVTHAQNSQNRKSQVGSTSKYCGVSWNRFEGKWRVAIMVNGHRILVGHFRTEEEAGQAAAEFRLQHAPFSRAA